MKTNKSNVRTPKVQPLGCRIFLPKSTTRRRPPKTDRISTCSQFPTTPTTLQCLHIHVPLTALRRRRWHSESGPNDSDPCPRRRQQQILPRKDRRRLLLCTVCQDTV